MDLTSLKAVRDGMMKYGFIAPDMTVHEFVENELPTVPAVPLDKLCEWLANNAYLKIDDEAAWELDADNWKQCLTKWMEEQDE